MHSRGFFFVVVHFQAIRERFRVFVRNLPVAFCACETALYELQGTLPCRGVISVSLMPREVSNTSRSERAVG